MSGNKGSDGIRLFLVKKVLREFKPSYIRAFSNYLLFTLMRAIEEKTSFKAIRHSILKPVALLVQVNKICNLNCSFCFVNDLNTKAAVEYNITPEVYRRVLTHPLLNSVMRIGFTGGEPLLHPHLFDFIEAAKRRVPVVTINSNFALAGRQHHGQRRIDVLNRSSVDMITISLYATNVAEIEAYAPLLKPHIYKRLAFIVSRGNDGFHAMGRMPEVAEMALRLGFNGVYFQNYDSMDGVEQKAANLNKLDVSGFSPIIGEPAYRRIRDQVARTFGRALDISFPVPKRTIPSPFKRFNCYQPDFQIGVDAKGNLSPCCNLDRLPQYGNLFTREHWNNDIFQRIRAGIKKPDVAPTPYCANCTYLDVNSHDV